MHRPSQSVQAAGGCIGGRCLLCDCSKADLNEAWAFPFGASGALTGFNRFPAAFEWLLLNELDVACSACFDDFSMIEPEALNASTLETVRAFFKFFRWPIKVENEFPFAEAFKALGVIFGPWGRGPAGRSQSV